MEYDDEGVAILGTYPISIVRLSAWGADDEPMPTVTSAVCDVCGKWASNLWIAGKASTADDSVSHVRVSRREILHVYACPEHSEQVVDSLLEEYGMASNTYDPDELAEKFNMLR